MKEETGHALRCWTGWSKNYYEDEERCYPAGIKYTLKYKAPWGQSICQDFRTLWHSLSLEYKPIFGYYEAVAAMQKPEDRTSDLQSAINKSCELLVRDVMLAGAKSGKLYKKENMEKLTKDFLDIFGSDYSPKEHEDFLYKLMNTSAQNGHLSKENTEILKEYFPYNQHDIDRNYTKIIPDINYGAFKKAMLNSIKSGTLEENIQKIKEDFPENLEVPLSDAFLSEFVWASAQNDKLSKNMEILQKTKGRSIVMDAGLIKNIIRNLANKGMLSENAETVRKYTTRLYNCNIDDLLENFEYIDEYNKVKNKNGIRGILKKLFGLN